MNSLKKISILLIVLAIAVGGFYFLFNKEKTYDFLFPGVNRANQAEKSFSLNDVATASKNFLIASKTNFVNKIKEAAGRSESLVEETSENAKTGVFNFFKKSVNDSVDSVGNKFGVNVGKSHQILTLKYSIKAGQPAYFSIKPSAENEEDLKYEIDWGDGKSEKGEIKNGKTKIVSHIWTNEENYIIKLKIIGGIQSAEYEESIMVIE